jgi:hypothetical protein
MNTRIFKCTSISFILALSGMGTAMAARYVVKNQETLSQIAHQSISGPVFGDNGSLHKLLALNPEIKNPDVIFPGQEIELPTHSTQTEVTVIPQTKTSGAIPELSSARKPAAEVIEDDLPQHVQIALGYHFQTFNSTDVSNGSSAKLFTSHDLEFNGTWSQDWSDRFSSFFQFGFQKLDFEPSNNASKSISNTEQAPAHFSLGADFHLSHKITFRTVASYGQELFTGSQNGSSISIDSVFVPSFSEEIIFSAYQRGRTSIGLEGGASYLLHSAASGYTVNSGYAVNGALFLNQNFGHENKDALTLLVGYENRTQNTSLIHQSVSDAFARLVFSLPVFGGDDK